MKKLYFFLACMALCLFNAFSAPQDTAVTRQIAANFYMSRVQNPHTRSPLSPQLTYTKKISLPTIRDSVEFFRIYNIDHGFVIVSTDDRFEPVLGYSTESNFDYLNLPDALLDFLNDYSEQIQTYYMNNGADNASIRAKWITLSVENYQPYRNESPAIGPLLYTRWNQDTYYNELCPLASNGPNGHAYTGCTATAMAQIIRYWQYPTHGIGSYNSVDFANATYDYSNMPEELSSTSTETQIFEVAQLMYHCGIGANMQYSSSGSSASLNDAANALRNHFGYADCYLLASCHWYDDTCISNETWKNLLKNELNNLQPVLFDGYPESGSGVGHAFVIDGYDQYDYFHCNWGWGGYCDGYYLISALNPGLENYSGFHQAVLGITASTPIIRFSPNSLSFFTESGSLTESQSISVRTHSVSFPITVSVTGNFLISTDSIHYYTSCTIDSSVWKIYVQYQPSVCEQIERGFLCFTSMNICDTVTLKGLNYSVKCEPPKNPTISTQDLNHIDINWDAASIDNYRENLSWIEGENLNFGWTIPYQSNWTGVTIAERFCDTNLIAMHDKQLTAISFYAGTGATAYKAVVYQGGSFDSKTDPGTQVYTQDINPDSVVSEHWNTVILDTPVTIDASQELLFGIYLESDGNNSPPIRCTHYETPFLTNLIGINYGVENTWTSYSSYAFGIKGIVTDMRFVSNYQIFRDEVPINMTNSLSCSDSLYETDTYLYTITANWSDGCSASTQKRFINIANISTSPEALDFYNNYGLQSNIKNLHVHTNGMISNIQASVNGNFQISIDSVNFSNNVSLGGTESTLYVKYVPNTIHTSYETGSIQLQSGRITATVRLTGQCFSECMPPQNLLLTQSDSIINLSWSTPETQNNQFDLTWCSELYFSNSGGASNINIKRYLMQRFEPSDLIDYHNKSLTAISFIPCVNATVYKLVVYQGGSYNGTTFNAGTLITEQDIDVSTLTSNAWNTVLLDQPVTINAFEELWYGIYVESAAGSYPIRYGRPPVLHKGSITKNMMASQPHWEEYEYGEGFSYTLKATITDFPLTLVGYQIDRNNQNIHQTIFTQHSDSLSTNDNYHYDVWAVWDNGCRAAVRNSIYVTGLSNHVGQYFPIQTCDSCQWYGENYTNSGIYYHQYDNWGYLQVDTLSLSLNHTTYGQENVNAIDSFVWHNTTFYESGDYTYITNNSNGCDSIATLHLNIQYTSVNEIFVTTCDSYIWYDSVLTSTGNYIQIFPNDFGPDSIEITHLTINNSTYGELYDTGCDNYTWNDSIYDVSGDYTQTFTNAGGCDSVMTLHLTINPSVTSEFTILHPDSCYIWNDETYCASGNYVQTLQTADGCDSTVTMHLTITVGVDYYDLTNVMILYPNPTKDVVNVQLKVYKEQLGKADILVFDTYGKLLEILKTPFIASPQTAQIDLSRYANGVYFFKAIADGQVLAIRKVVKIQ